MYNHTSCKESHRNTARDKACGFSRGRSQDDYIIQKAIKLHKQQKKKSFMKSARLIGEVIGYLDQYIGDEYFEYRVRHLIMNGVFEIEGIPKAMWFYSVKLKNI
ncbi:DUF3658 domain-containing protein [Bacillus tuaregi]|uniref:DUF3658 domain-containing protein n=1 Tax=Bacillus tuaregi TaxID=1816695 RepID=UPI0008F8C803|nr:DUF3658 domain-containing protein [Bacillus tuaregi]